MRRNRQGASHAGGPKKERHVKIKLDPMEKITGGPRMAVMEIRRLFGQS
jgi:hypothetical protein